jgi:cysteinyl-tRNA synthetase
VHNGFLTMDTEKMSKSLGNVRLIHDLVKQAPGEAIRWALLSAHYRAPLDWTGRLLDQARNNLDKIYGALRRAKDVELDPAMPVPAGVLDSLEDDLNTPRAIAELFALAKTLETSADPEERSRAKTGLIAGGALMGVLQADPDAWFEGGADEDFKAKIDDLLAQRDEARRAKDWPTADRIRGELDALNVVVMDGPDGAVWRFRE